MAAATVAGSPRSDQAVLVVRREAAAGGAAGAGAAGEAVSKLHVVQRVARGDARAQEGLRRLLVPSSEQERARAGFVTGSVPCPYAPSSGKRKRGRREEGQRGLEWRISPGMCAANASACE
jgi:hypothetical protein